MQDKNNLFYRDKYPLLMIGLISGIVFLILFTLLILYQVSHRPIPVFSAVSDTGQALPLTAAFEPNLQASTLIKWASKAAVAAYTFDFVRYNEQFELARPYFTSKGWSDYQSSVSRLIATITQNQLFVNGVVSAPPVISNQGEYPGRGYTWRIQIPFLVTYQSAEQVERKEYTVIVTIVKVPTSINPAGIGVDQFVMR